tara:strand:+ start:382 stop:549 length:168 start_codon:yes stop_codon:yes gene_type:complete
MPQQLTNKDTGYLSVRLCNWNTPRKGGLALHLRNKDFETLKIKIIFNLIKIINTA